VFGYGAVGAPRGITVAWGLTRPKSGPDPKDSMVSMDEEVLLLVICYYPKADMDSMYEEDTILSIVAIRKFIKYCCLFRKLK